MTAKMNILMIGCGKMGGAMLRRWCDACGHSFAVVDPAMPDLPPAVRVESELSALSSQVFDMIIVAIKPQMIESVLPDYKGSLKNGGVVVSIAAGFALRNFSKILGDVPLVRVMPNLPALIGLGATGLYANALCSHGQKNTVEELMEAVGRAFWVNSEDELDKVTAVSGSGPGYVFQIIESYIAAAEDLGFKADEARALVLQTILGATEMANRSSEAISALRESVTSKNGTTEAGLNALNGDGALDTLMKQTTDAAYKRAIELQ
ncbi:pyrroline-5-carboxylate reductase [Kordiimonas sp.]|uniref:pyrroline-5-carboxylate reductase n=1 Tax=Kordiimonas sp. TaxID=1970157 RepID=UPI003A94B4B6